MTDAPASSPSSPPFKIDQQTLTKLAREVAMALRPLSDILADTGITEDYYNDHVVTIPWYKQVLDTFTIEWNRPMKTEERLRLESLATLETGMPHLGARMLDGKETFPAAIEAAKLFAKIGKVDGSDKSPNSGERFSLIINLGGDEKLVIERGQTEEAGGGPSIPSFPEGQSGNSPVQQISSQKALPAPVSPVSERSGDDAPVPDAKP